MKTFDLKQIQWHVFDGVWHTLEVVVILHAFVEMYSMLFYIWQHWWLVTHTHGLREGQTKSITAPEEPTTAL